MLRFCKVCRKIQDERWMYSADVCELCRDAAEEGRKDDEDETVGPGSKAEPASAAGDDGVTPYIPGLWPAQG